MTSSSVRPDFQQRPYRHPRNKMNTRAEEKLVYTNEKRDYLLGRISKKIATRGEWEVDEREELAE